MANPDKPPKEVGLSFILNPDGTKKLCSNLNGFSEKDKLVLIAGADLVSTSKGMYKLISSFSQNDRGAGVAAYYLTFERFDDGDYGYNIRRTR